MEKPSVQALASDEKKRIGYIEGREDLLQTRILDVPTTHGSGDEDTKEVLVLARDPGSANAVLPVIEILRAQTNVDIKVLADGYAKEIVTQQLSAIDITPQHETSLQNMDVIGTPDIMLITTSASEMGMQTFASSTFVDAPSVVIEDYYGTSKPYLARLLADGLPLPEKICVQDEEAKHLIVKDLPALESRVVVTGQPIFDRLLEEDTEGINARVRETLGIRKDEKLVTFMSTIDRIELVEKLAQELKQIKGPYRFSFRRHPRDPVSLETYERLFQKEGIPYIDTQSVPTSDVGAASDVVVSVSSTESITAIYRRKPTIHIMDGKYANLRSDYPPAVRAKASLGVEDMDALGESIQQLLDTNSETVNSLSQHMEQSYPLDGKNAERIASVVQNVLAARG